MGLKNHNYNISVLWTGNLGSGTSAYNAYERSHLISGNSKNHDIVGSSDPSFRGDTARYNPEELLLASISTCHMLWYLHLCAVNKVVVVDYKDDASATMIETADGGGHFTSATLFPKIKVTNDEMIEEALELHHEAHKLCFIANSVNFEIKIEAEVAAI